MKTLKMFVISFLFIFTVAAQAGVLSTTVDRDTVGTDQNVNLRVELSDGRTDEIPDFSPLRNDFEIAGRGESRITKIVNGHSTASRVWQLLLRPKHEGRIQIPSLRTTTTASAPINIRVTDTAVSSTGSGISFKGRAEHGEIYQGQRVRVDYILKTAGVLQNLQMPDFSIPGAIVERIGEPVVAGTDVRFSYFVTPLTNGDFKIPALAVKGQRIVRPKAETSGLQDDPFGDFFADDHGGMFAQMRSMMKRFGDSDLTGGFGELQPVTLKSGQVSLQVLPPVAGVRPWLPAKRIAISASLGQEPAMMGEPIQLSVRSEASGISMSRLPSFDDQLSASGDFKVYPESSSESKSGADVSVREQKYTLIPQKSGTIKTPSIKIDYFDVDSRTMKTAVANGETIQVATNPNLAASSQSRAGKDMAATAPPTPASATAKSQPSWSVIYSVAATLAFLLLAVFSYRRFKKTSSAQPVSTKTSISDEPKTVSLKALKTCSSVAEVSQFIKNFAHTNWGLPAGASLTSIIERQSLGEEDRSRFIKIKKVIEADLYSNQPADLDKLRAETEMVLRQASKRPARPPVGNRERLPELNPL